MHVVGLVLVWAVIVVAVVATLWFCGIMAAGIVAEIYAGAKEGASRLGRLITGSHESGSIPRRPIGTAVVLTILIAAIVAGIVHQESSGSKLTADQRASFLLMASSDPALSSLEHADPDGLVKTAEDSCAYRARGHTQEELLANLGQSGVPANVTSSLADDAEVAFCPSYIAR